MAAIPSLGCQATAPHDLEVGIEEFKFAVEVDLVAAVRADQVYAVGSNFVAAQDGTVWEFPQPLHDIENIYERVVVVVGDGGFVALTPYVHGERIQEFTEQPTNTDADLFGVVGDKMQDDLTLIAVGDNAVVVGVGDPASGPLLWTAAQAPSGGWGVLRSVRRDHEHVCALGDGGALVCAELSDLTWQSVNLGAEVDRIRFCEGGRWEAGGTNGAYVSVNEDVFSDWLAFRLASFDIAACSTTYTNYPIVVGTNRTIYRTWDTDVEAESLVSLDWQPLAFDSEWGTVLVGEGGNAAHLSLVPIYDF